MKSLFVGLMAVMSVVFGARAAGPGDTSWMPGSFGVSYHWTAGIVRDNSPSPSTWGAAEWNRSVNAFDTEALAESAQQSGADYVIFTVAHALQQLPCPSARLDRILPGRTATRDLVSDLIDSLAKRNIRLILYYNHSCNGQDDPPWMDACGYNSITNEADMARFANNICGILEELSDRYGPRVAGWWFDSGSSVQASGKNVNILHGQQFPWERFMAAARHGNPRLAVAVNSGENANSQYAGTSCDYFAGENTRVDIFCTSDPNNGLQSHVWTCADDRRWLWSRKNGWTGSRFPSVYALKSWIVGQRAARRLATLNVLIDDKGNVNPKMAEQLKACWPIGTVWEQTRYNTDAWRPVPSASNALAGVSAEFGGTRWQFGNRGMDATPTSVLTDGKICGIYNNQYNKSVFGISSHATFAWNLASAVDIYGFKAYSLTGGGGNDGFVIGKVEVRRPGSEDWVKLDVPALDIGINIQNNFTGGSLLAHLRNTEGEPIAKGVIGLRVTFGTVEENGICIPEMELVSAPTSTL